MRICMIAGDNPHYVHSLVQSLASTGLKIDLLGGDCNEVFEYPGSVKFINVRGSTDPDVSTLSKVIRITRYYWRCLFYMCTNNVRVVHIQAFRFKFAEGIILVLLYKLLGKRVVYTAHNVKAKEGNSIFNHLVFFIIYRSVHHVICHTGKIRAAIATEFGIRVEKMSIVDHGMNVSVPRTDITRIESRNRLDIDPQARVLLLFGMVRPYKGHEIALHAVEELSRDQKDLLLLVVGDVLKRDESYLDGLHEYVNSVGLRSAVRFYTRYVPDDEVEVFFKAADGVLLPYREGNFQSGVLYLAYRFGLPVVASDVGSFPEEIESGVLGYVFRSGDVRDLAARVRELFLVLGPQSNVREYIMQRAKEKYTCDRISGATLDVYRRVLYGGEGGERV